MSEAFPDQVRAVDWHGDHMTLLDQRLLPHTETRLRIDTLDAAARAITDMVVRGAPAIGIAAAYGAVLGAFEARKADGERWRDHLRAALPRLAAARPTAVNLRWAVDQVAAALQGNPRTPESLEVLARRIHEEDIRANRRMGELGAQAIGKVSGVLTHCNAGALATGGYGTALGVIRSAWAGGSLSQVFAGETRPWLQGARLTAWELLRDGIPVKLVADGATAWLMQSGAVNWVVVGADRVAANGDVANKIGTYGLAVSARQHGVKFMVVAPTSTVDMQIVHGTDIPIEERGAEELLMAGGHVVAAPGAGAWNPVFDVTPAALVDVLVTERGAVREPNVQKIAELMA
ncbi:MAG: S-methyl-5-thioribose-1-phosphate isomerase [Chromatiales bacterium]|jgi:methylthioribose-1-phosphate isomerase|nr:S-methyl-5-thioribose-1-phosphate isomerase [Chromatiales bacterium]